MRVELYKKIEAIFIVNEIKYSIAIINEEFYVSASGITYEFSELSDGCFSFKIHLENLEIGNIMFDNISTENKQILFSRDNHLIFCLEVCALIKYDED